MSEDLSRPVPGEAANLELHVEMCARRHGAIERRLKRLELVHYAAFAVGVSAIAGGAMTAQQMLELLRTAADVLAAVPDAPRALAMPLPR